MGVVADILQWLESLAGLLEVMKTAAAVTMTMQSTLLQVVCAGVWAWHAGVEAGMRDVSRYPACVVDEGAFRTCKKRSDCEKLLQDEGGDGGNGDCYRHPDRRTVHTGICLDRREIVPCFDHASCATDLKCTNGVCGDSEYFKALGDMQCEDDDLCEDLLLGSQCCFDIHGGVASWSNAGAGAEWGKTCCDNEHSPVKRPRQGLTRQEMAKLDKKIMTFYTPWGLDQIICEGLDYQIMLKLSSCQEFTTSTSTTTSSSTTTVATRTTRTVKKSKQQETSNSASTIFTYFSVFMEVILAVLL